MNCNQATPDVFPLLPLEAWRKSDGLETPGPWWVPEDIGTSWDEKGNALTTRPSAIIRTPDGALGRLGNHQIAADGTVTPSVLIRDGSGERYHDFVRLDGWERRDAWRRARGPLPVRTDRG